MLLGGSCENIGQLQQLGVHSPGFIRCGQQFLEFKLLTGVEFADTFYGDRVTVRAGFFGHGGNFAKATVLGSVDSFGPEWALLTNDYVWGHNTSNATRKLAEAVPEGLKSVREDLERNFRSVLQTSLTKLDLVTREEFEVQEAVLAKTRSKLEALEARLREIEES